MSAAYMTTYTTAAAVTPSDSTAVRFTALYVGGAGNVVVRMAAGGNTVTFSTVPAGVTLQVECDRVMVATSATNIVGLA